MTTQLDGDAINRALAEKMGWAFDVAGQRVYAQMPVQALRRDGGSRFPLDYCHDMNALRDGPEAKLRDAGWTLIVETGGADGGTIASWLDELDIVRAEEGDATEAAARAAVDLAALAALTALAAAAPEEHS